MLEKFEVHLWEKDWEWRKKWHHVDNANTHNMRNTVGTRFDRVRNLLNGGTRYMGNGSMYRGRGRTGSLPYYVRLCIFSSTHP